MFTNTPPPLHALQAAARLNEGACTFVTAQSQPKLYIFFIFILYYTTYNTAHAASKLWRYSSIYMNPF